MKIPEGTNPLEVLREAIKAVPSVRYALGVAGVFAAIAIIVSFNLGFKAGVFGFASMLIAMTVLLVFANVALQNPAEFRWPGKVLIWFSIFFVIATAILLATSVFFARPLDLRSLLNIPTPVQPATIPPIQKAPETTGTTVTIQKPPPDIEKPSATHHQRQPITAPGDDQLAVLWERRGDQAAQTAILVEIKWAENGKPDPVYTIDQAPGDEYVPIIAGFEQAYTAWRKAAETTKNPKHIKALREKISGSSGLTCDDALTEKIFCYRNASDYDVLNSNGGARSGKHVRASP